MEGALEDFPTFFSVCENIAWTSRRDMIGWPPDSRGTWVVFAFSGSSHHLPETEVANRCEFWNGLEFGGIEKALTRSAGTQGNSGRHSGSPQISGPSDSWSAQAGGVGVSHGGVLGQVALGGPCLTIASGRSSHREARSGPDPGKDSITGGSRQTTSLNTNLQFVCRHNDQFPAAQLPTGLLLGWNGVPPEREGSY